MFQGSVGLPLASVDARIVDNSSPGEEEGTGGGAMGGDIAEDGKEGELQIKGPAVFQGYVRMCVCEKGTLCVCACVQVSVRVHKL